jgi:tyrosine-specific transport protein
MIYFMWEISILGTVSVNGVHGLAHAFKADLPLAKLLRIEMKSDFIAVLTRCFSIFAIVTSFLGVAQGLFDFLKDGLKTNESHKTRILAFLLTFLPPVLLIIIFKSGFITLLEYAGALVSIILGIIPILIVWSLRKQKDKVLVYRAPGNSFALALGIAFFAFVVLLVLLKNLKIINFDVASLIL